MGGYFPYILLNEIQRHGCSHNLQSDWQRVLPADLCTSHALYVKGQKINGFEKEKNMAVEGGTVYYILVIRNF